jgi:hypothetical protein
MPPEFLVPCGHSNALIAGQLHQLVFENIYEQSGLYSSSGSVQCPVEAKNAE